jgi:hypothetical protein
VTPRVDAIANIPKAVCHRFESCRGLRQVRPAQRSGPDLDGIAVAGEGGQQVEVMPVSGVS